MRHLTDDLMSVAGVARPVQREWAALFTVVVVQWLTRCVARVEVYPSRTVAMWWPRGRTLMDIRGHESPKRRRALSDGKLSRVASRQQFVFPSRAGSSPVSRSRYLGPKRQV